MHIINLKSRVEDFVARKNQTKEEAIALFQELKSDLETGKVRAAEKIDAAWLVNTWVKEAILLGFKYGDLIEQSHGDWHFYEKHTLGLGKINIDANIRIVPGGTTVRCGAYVAPGTVIMPPSYINIGAYLDTGCMIDSHVLVGSCAQIGKNVHLSAAAQIGGVLEPVGALPVIIEDDVFIGGNTGIYEGTIIKQGAVIGTGVILNASTHVFDNTTGEFIKKTADQSLIIPPNAVVVAGSRPINQGLGREHGMHLYCPIIIKYRDAKTSAAILLEDLLR